MLHCEYITQMEHFFNAYSFACKSMWKDSTDDVTVFCQAQKAFDFYSKGCTKNSVFFRLTGQSGSGKTSQLLQAANHFCAIKNIKPLHIAVRNFACFHPDYQKLKDNENFREITNGFALKVLIWVLKFAFEKSYDIILELSLLDKKFENYVFFEINNQKYKHFFHIMAVNKIISDIFILKRHRTAKRITADKSANYFDKTLVTSFKYLTKKYTFDCVVWSAFDKQPVFFGSSKKAFRQFTKSRKSIQKVSFTEPQLLSAKKIWMEEQYRDVSL